MAVFFPWLTFILSFLHSTVIIAAENEFYIINHMSNTPEAVDWAIANGANALEMDLTFDNQGNPIKFTHGSPCDCQCVCIFSCPKDHVCSIIQKSAPKGSGACAAYASIHVLLKHIAKKSLPMVMINCKIDGKLGSKEKQIEGAKKTIKLLEEHLINAGYLGDVVIIIQKDDAIEFLKTFTRETYHLKNKIYITIENTKNTIVRNIQSLQSTGSKNIVYNTGSTSCWFNTMSTETYQLAAMNKAEKVVSMTYTWTLDKPSSLKKAARYFNGIITNKPGVLHKIAVQELGLKLATSKSRLSPATTTNVIHSLAGRTCDCKYQKGGCIVVEKPPTGLACRCQYKGLWTCGGTVVACQHAHSKYCVGPDFSIHTCIQGGGDCDGYKSVKCDCSYSSGGCKITRHVPPNLACRCHYKGFWTCNGDVVKCKDPASAYCSKPDRSIQSCLQGGGDCGGYSSCDCSYRSNGGCIITKPAPKNHACKCKYKGFWTCGGEVAHCRIKTANLCRHPDTSIQSCTLGSGDCDGYSTACDCSYSSGGCTITRGPPKTTACRCSYRGFWTCTGSVVHCSNYVHSKCQNPDRSKSTCHFGGGNCGGYARRRRRFWGKKKDSKRNAKRNEKRKQLNFDNNI